MTVAANLTGQKFGMITVLQRHFVPNTNIPHAQWLCQCECGKQFIALATNLKKQIRGIKSCGCYMPENVRIANTTHGMYHTTERISWSSMQGRCCNSNNKDYPNYGGRGIFVCDRWLGKDGFVHFIEDMGMKPFPDASIERVDVNKGYSKDNCIWIKVSLQAKNRNYNKIKNKDHADRIREEFKMTEISMKQIAIQNNCSVPTIHKIITNQSWT